MKKITSVIILPVLVLLIVLVGCSPTIKKTILKPVGQTNQIEKIIKVKEGTFIIKDVSLTHWDNVTLFNMSITNNTTLDWEHLYFELDLFTDSGDKINVYKVYKINQEMSGRDSDKFFQPRYFQLRKNETRYLYSSSNEHRRLYSDGIYGLVDSLITSYNIRLKDIKESYHPKYLFSLIKPKENSNLFYKDSFIKIGFSITTREIGFVLKNETQFPIKIDWDSVSYVDYFGNSHRIIHSGIQYIKRNSSQIPTIIPPMSKLTDNIFPVDYIEWNNTSNSWDVKSFFPGDVKSKKLKGRNVMLFLPLNVNGKVINYQFVFEIVDV